MGEEPLASRMRPRSFEEFVGQSHLLGPGKPLTKLVEGGHLPSIVLWGPPGSGKTTLAHLLARAVDAHLVELSAVSSGVADARRVMDRARHSMFRTVLFIDEVHRWSKAQQDVLLPAVEDGTISLIGATTENPFFSLVSPLLSRCIMLRLDPLEEKEVRAVLLTRVGEDVVDLERVSDAIHKKAVVYDRDTHYDVVSAFIKSMRGSDPDAVLFWLARMLEAGEDPRFIARRMVILTSEDVGLADPHA